LNILNVEHVLDTRKLYIMAPPLNLTQAAKLVGVSRNTLYAAIRDGRLVCAMAGRPGRSTFVTVEALQQAGFLVPEEAMNVEHSDERAIRAQRPERPERVERAERPAIERSAHAEISENIADLHDTLDRFERTVERLERSLNTAIDRMDERAERSIERALERVVERLLERRAREAIPAIPVRPLTSHPKTHPEQKAAVLARMRELKARGLSLQAMADRLNAEGVPTLSGKGRWQKGTIANLLAGK
jgi:excisionase family DNA binding protein